MIQQKLDWIAQVAEKRNSYCVPTKTVLVSKKSAIRERFFTLIPSSEASVILASS